jgi:hypothetical protein
MMKLLVIGQSDDMMRQIVRELLAPEFLVRILMVGSQNESREWTDQVEVTSCVMFEKNSLNEVLEGVESVLWCIPFQDSADDRLLELARELSPALCAAGVSRLVTVRNMSTKGLAVERLLNNSGMAIRHLCWGNAPAPLLLESQSIGEPGPNTADPVRIMAMDVVDLALRWLVRRDWNGVQDCAVESH